MANNPPEKLMKGEHSENCQAMRWAKQDYVDNFDKVFGGGKITRRTDIGCWVSDPVTFFREFCDAEPEKCKDCKYQEAK